MNRVSVALTVPELQLMRTALDIVRLQILSQQPSGTGHGLAIEYGGPLDECEIDVLADRFKVALIKFDKMGDADPTPEQRNEYNRVAREEMRTVDRVSFDEPIDTVLSPSEDGCYVQAWVWVAKEEIDCPHDRTRMNAGISSCLECGDRIDTYADGLCDDEQHEIDEDGLCDGPGCRSKT